MRKRETSKVFAKETSSQGTLFVVRMLARGFNTPFSRKETGIPREVSESGRKSRDQPGIPGDARNQRSGHSERDTSQERRLPILVTQ